MQITNKQELENAVDLFHLNGKESLLHEIREVVENNKWARDEMLEKLKYHYDRYIIFFNIHDQIQILGDSVRKISSDGKIYAGRAHWLMIYASEKAVTEVLESANEFEIRSIMEKIVDTVDMIGHRYCDPWSPYPWLVSTTFFSRMRERRDWRKLYKLCKKYV